MTNMTIEQNYQLYFLAINSYATGNPDKKAKLIWHTLIENVVDDKTTCDDSGYEGIKLKERVKQIGKEKVIAVEDMIWIDKELKKYFADSLKAQKKDLTDLMFEHIVNGEITSQEAAPFYDKFQKQQHFYNKFK